MRIQIKHLLTGAKQAKGLTVIIDVFRGCSTAAYIMNQGASYIIPVGSVKEALLIKEKHTDYILVGERKGIRVPGFDHGNSPTEVINNNFLNKVIIMTTSACTKAIVNAQQASELILGSFVNISCIVNYIKQKKPEYVSLVPLGLPCLKRTPEDELCAGCIKNLLKAAKFILANTCGNTWA